MTSIVFFDETPATSDNIFNERLVVKTSQGSFCDSEESTAASDGDSPTAICTVDTSSSCLPCNNEEAGHSFRVWAHNKLQEGEFQRRALLDSLGGHVAVLAFHAHGSRVLQEVLDVASAADFLNIAGELQGAMRMAVVSPHACHVVEKLLLLLPAAVADRLLAELVKATPEVARDRRGCRVLCRALEHHGPIFEDGFEALVDAVLADAAELSRHPFGHHVVEAVLVHGSDRHRQCVAAALRGRLARGARNRSASYVVQRALCTCNAKERDAIVCELLGKPQNITALARSQFGCHVVRTILELDGSSAKLALDQLAAVKDEIQGDKYGSRLLEELGLCATAVVAH